MAWLALASSSARRCSESATIMRSCAILMARRSASQNHRASLEDGLDKGFGVMKAQLGFGKLAEVRLGGNTLNTRRRASTHRQSPGRDRGCRRIGAECLEVLERGGDEALARFSAAGQVADGIIEIEYLRVDSWRSW